MTGSFSRRSVLRTAGTLSGVGLLGTQAAAAEGTAPFIVGTSSRAAERAAQRRAESVYRELDFGSIGRAIAGQFSPEARNALQQRADVRYVEADGAVFALSQSLPWGIDRIDADVAHANGETGSGADIAIIDTGIDSDHPDLQANIGDGYAVVACEGSNCNYAWDDDHDHGTHCAGIAGAVNNSEGVVGVSTEATLHAVKVLDDYGGGTFSGVAEGVQWVADQGYDVGSISLGASSGSSTIKDACQYAYDKGVLLVAAAGNDGPCTDCVMYPAAYATVVAVSSIDMDDELSSFSSTGPEVELAAPGGYIYSTIIGGYETMSGTSMACPHVAGAAGQIMANGYSNTEARDRLQTTAEDIGLSSNEQGNGLLDVEAALADSGGDTSVAVATDSASSIGETSATLNGSLTDLGGADSADCYFEYRESGTSSWSTTSTQTLSSTGSFSQDISGLSSGTEYEYRAVADASDGDTDTGGSVTFTTNTADTNVAVTTDSATSVGETSATLNGSLDDLGGASSADCYFEYRVSGTSTWSATSAQTLSATGSFSQDITGLEDGVDYEYRAVADASDGDADTGSSVAFTTTNDPPVVTTDSPTNVMDSSATLNGSLDDLGKASSADCYFEYRESGTSTWSSTSAQTLSSTGAFSQDVSGLSSGTDYEYRAVADASDGDTATGSSTTFTTNTSESSLVADTDNASSVGETSATLNGSLDDLGGADSADVYFEWGESGGSLPNMTSKQTLSSTGAFEESISGLSTDTEYEFRATADASDGDTDTGSLFTFTTDSGSTTPVVDSYTVTEAGSPNPHAEITADWAVSDADGDLDTVLVEVIDSSGTVVDSAQTNVSGSSASGTDKFKLKHANNQTFDVRLTVSDASGNSATKTKSVSS